MTQNLFRSTKLEISWHPEKICHLIDQFAALSHLCYGLWALVQVRFVKLDYDYTPYARCRLNRFRELKSLLFSE
jgi:hypothetical protein